LALVIGFNNLKKSILQSNSGFTLLEIMIAIGLFTIVMLVTTSMFLQSIDSQARSVSSKDIQEGLNHALTIMSNQLAQAKKDVGCTCPADKPYFCLGESASSLTFKNVDNQCSTYSLVESPASSGNNILAVSYDGGEPIALTPNNINISKLVFSLTNADRLDFSIARNTILLEAKSLARENHPDTMSLQTTITVGQ